MCTQLLALPALPLPFASTVAVASTVAICHCQYSRYFALQSLSHRSAKNLPSPPPPHPTTLKKTKKPAFPPHPATDCHHRLPYIHAPHYNEGIHIHTTMCPPTCRMCGCIASPHSLIPNAVGHVSTGANEMPTLYLPAIFSE